MTEATPRPWEYDPELNRIKRHGHIVAQMLLIRGTQFDGMEPRPEITTANAELIVQAVNSHDALVAAATELLDALSLEKAGVLTGHGKSLIARLKVEAALTAS